MNISMLFLKDILSNDNKKYKFKSIERLRKKHSREFQSGSGS